MNEFNKNLFDLYSTQWERFRGKLLSYNDPEDNEEDDNEEDYATNPMLLSVGDSYENTKTKIMIFGQETNCWGTEFSETGAFHEGITINQLTGLYNDFYTDQCKHNTPFFSWLRLIKKNIADSYVVWNNVLKVGRCSSGTPKAGLINETSVAFRVILDEINILKPDVLLFFSGYKYDDYIRRFIGDFTIKSISGYGENELCMLIFKDNISVKCAIRTYHPGYLNRQPKGSKLHRERLIPIIIEAIKS